MRGNKYWLRWAGHVLFTLLYAGVMGIGLLEVYEKEAAAAFAPVGKRVVMLDAGHGGKDPGMVAQTGQTEAPINLAITEQIQRYLELGGAVALMTRTDEAALGGNKREDMSARRALADNSAADILVSIHQNSYPDETVRGAQVFYNGNSAEGKRLAESIQTALDASLSPEKAREAKANASYYLLKETDVVAVIVECGFLTNEEEGRLLSRGEYQERVAWAVYTGIVQYFINTPTHP